MSVTMERNESHLLIRLEGAVNLTSAAELKGLLIEGLASGSELVLDLESADEIDITVMQLLWAAGREAARTGARVEIRMSEAAGVAMRAAGFDCYPGLSFQG